MIASMPGEAFPATPTGSEVFFETTDGSMHDGTRNPLLFSTPPRTDAELCAEENQLFGSSDEDGDFATPPVSHFEREATRLHTDPQAGRRIVSLEVALPVSQSSASRRHRVLEESARPATSDATGSMGK